MSAKLFAMLMLLTIIGLIVVVKVRASVDDVDTYFENVRGQLLGFYGSEIVSHSAIILGLIVALPSIVPRVWKALNLRGTSLRTFLRYFTRALTVVTIGTLILYTAGRLFFWSAQATSLMVATRTNLGVNITDSNVTLCMNALTNFTLARFWSDPAATSRLARLFLSSPYLYVLVPTIWVGSSILLSALWVGLSILHRQTKRWWDRRRVDRSILVQLG